MIFSACSFGGMYKSALLKRRTEKLLHITRAVDDMSERIRAQAIEAEKLVNICFEKHTVFIVDGQIKFNKNFLKKDDINLLEEFFDNFGMQDINGEYDRTKFYVNLLYKQYEQAMGESAKLCRLYNSLGILGGIFLCIFLL